MKRHVLKIAFLLLLLMPWGCSFDDCGDLEQTYLDITGMEGRNVLLLEGGYSIVESLSAGNEVVYHLYGISISPQAIYTSDAPVQQSGLSFLPKAYACSPALPAPTETVADIAIFSDNDYVQASSSRVLTAGDTLNGIFNIYDYYSGRIVGLPDFLVDEDLAASDQGFILQPSTKPAAAQSHAFTIHYRLTNGEFYQLTLPAVELVP